MDLLYNPFTHLCSTARVHAVVTGRRSEHRGLRVIRAVLVVGAREHALARAAGEHLDVSPHLPVQVRYFTLEEHTQTRAISHIALLKTFEYVYNR